MKKSIVILALLIVNTCFASSMKVGVLDLQRIVAESKVVKEMNLEIDKQFESKKKEILDLQKKLESKAQALKSNTSKMKKEQSEKKANELNSLRTELGRKAEDFRRELQIAQAKASKEFTLKIEKEVEKIGKADNFDLILHKHATVYLKNKLDITKKLITALG